MSETETLDHDRIAIDHADHGDNAVPAVWPNTLSTWIIPSVSRLTRCRVAQLPLASDPAPAGAYVNRLRIARGEIPAAARPKLRARSWLRRGCDHSVFRLGPAWIPLRAPLAENLDHEIACLLRIRALLASSAQRRSPSE
jgi:hypothetical protein